MAWKAFNDDAGTQWWAPDPISTKIFLKQVSEKGSSTARTRMSYLKWLNDNLGLSFDLTAVRVKKAGQIADTHVATPIPPLLPRLWIAWDRLLMTPDLTPFETIIALAWDLMATSVLRPKHLFMSTLTVLDNRIEGLCCKGKARIAGRRLAFYWACPRMGIAGANLGNVVSKIMDFITLQGLEFDSILPNFAPLAVPLANISALAPGTMTRSKFLKFSSDLCVTKRLTHRTT
jgi:hypothetical protein